MLQIVVSSVIFGARSSVIVCGGGGGGGVAAVCVCVCMCECWRQARTNMKLPYMELV